MWNILEQFSIKLNLDMDYIKTMVKGVRKQYLYTIHKFYLNYLFIYLKIRSILAIQNYFLSIIFTYSFVNFLKII
jgi:hypothetical protein